MTSLEQNKDEIKDQIIVDPTNELEFEMSLSTAHDYIASAYQAMCSVAELDTQIMSKEDELRIKKMKRKCILIIDNCIDELYNEIFEEEITT